MLFSLFLMTHRLYSLVPKPLPFVPSIYITLVFRSHELLWMQTTGKKKGRPRNKAMAYVLLAYSENLLIEM